MAHRRHHKNIGGGTWYAGGESNVAKEAEEKGAKHGGHVKHHRRKTGGRAVGSPSGLLTGGRLDKRARGGSIPKFARGGGSDRNPFSSAAASADKGKPNQMHGTSIGRATGGGVKKK